MPGSFLIIKTVNVLLFLFGITLPSLIKKKKRQNPYMYANESERAYTADVAFGNR